MAKVPENKIVELVRYELLNPYHETGVTLDIDATLAVAAGIVLSHWDNIAFTEDMPQVDAQARSMYLKAGNLKPLSHFLKSLSSRHLTRLISLNRTAREKSLTAVFQRIGFSNKQVLAAGLPYLSFKEGENFTVAKSDQYITNILSRKPTLALQYGELNDDQPEVIMPTTPAPKPKHDFISFCKEYLEAIIPEAHIKRAPYLWKLRLAHSKYLELKDSLNEVFTKHANHQAELVKALANWIVLYIGEWYKWEYNGLLGEDTVWGSIGVSTNYSKRLWEWSFLSRYGHLCYQGPQRNLPLRSICVLGGFPLIYLHNDKFQSLYDQIVEVYNDPEVEWQDQEVDLGGTAPTKSISDPKGSLHLLVTAISHNEKPYAGCDLTDNENVIGFIKRLTQGLEEGRKQKVKVNMLFDYEIGENVLYPRMEVSLMPDSNISSDNSRGFIHYSTMRSWGFSDPSKLDYLEIVLEAEDFRRSLFTFYNCHNETFVIGGSRTSCEIYDFPYSSKRVAIKAIDSHQQERPISTYTLWGEHGYVQAFQKETTSPWSTAYKQGIASIVIYQNDVWLCDQKDSWLCGVDYEDNSEVVGVALVGPDGCVLKNDQGERKCFKHKASDIVTLEPRMLKSIEYQDGLVKLFEDHDGEFEESLIPLVVNSPGVVVKAGGVVQKSKDYTLEFRQESTHYRVWTNGTRPATGICLLRATVGNKDSQPLRCFVISTPDDEKHPIRRDIPAQTIRFNESIPILEPEITSGRLLDNLEQSQLRVSVKVKVGAPKCFIEILVYRALERKDLWREDKILNPFRPQGKASAYTIPMSRRKDFTVKVLNEDGYQAIPPSEDLSFINPDYIDTPFDALYKITFNHNDKEHVKYVLWEPYKPISPIYRSEYEWYYWNLETDGDVEFIPVSYKVIPQRENALEIQFPPNFEEEKRIRGGVIFQSLRNGLRPNRLFMPTKMPKGTCHLIPKVLDVIAEHNVPFRTFDQIFEVIFTPERKPDDLLTDFFLKYAQRYAYELSQNQYALLWRMAEELVFDWTFLTLYNWKTSIKRLPEEQQDAARTCVKNLLLHNPNVKLQSVNERVAHRKLINIIFSLHSSSLPEGTGIGNTAIKFLSRPNARGRIIHKFTGAGRDAKTICKFLSNLYDPEKASFQNIYSDLTK